MMNVNTSKIGNVLGKLKKKDPVLFGQIQKKINQIASLSLVEINHFKNLKHDSSEYKRVRMGSFILFFRLEGNTIIFERFKHHDGAYR